MNAADNPRREMEEFSEVEIVASHWLIRHEAELSDAERREFAAWLDADSNHRAVYSRLERSWSLLDAVPEAFPNGVPPSAPSPVAERPEWRWMPRVQFAGAAAIAFAAIVVWDHHSRARNAPADMRAATDVGEIRNVPLPDGSAIQLNTDSTVRVQFSPEERRVRLDRGEAHFTVAKNPARPFFVEAGNTVVRAVGTAFNVRLRPQGVDILVTEGKIRVGQSSPGESLIAEPVATAADQPLLSAGQRMTVSDDGGALPATADVKTARPDEIERALAWQERWLKFGAVPLAEVVAEFNRHNRHQLVIDNPVLAGQRFGGTFRPDGYQTLVDMLESTFGVVAERREDRTILRRKGDL